MTTAASRRASHAVIITGTVGVGRTAVAAALGNSLAASGIAHAVIDLDGLRRFWPAPETDPFHLAMELRNLASVAGNYRDAGAERLVMSGVLERRDDLALYRQAVALPLAVVRLRAAAHVVKQRLQSRHAGDQDALAWHEARATQLDHIMDEAAVADCDLATDDRNIDEVARILRSEIGW